MMPPKVVFKIRGTLYETTESTLRRYPTTLLGSESKRMEFRGSYNENETITLDCKPITFDAILFYYQSFGILRRPPQQSMDEFVRDCRKFQIDEKDIRKMQEQEGFLYERSVILDRTRFALQGDLWRFLEMPESSMAASLFAVVSCLLIAASTCLTCVQTLPSVKATENAPFQRNPLLLVELSLNLFFGLEYLLRFLSAPKKWEFLKSFSNSIDFLAVYPYLIALAVDVKSVSTVKFLRVVRTVRIMRLIRLTKHSRTLDIAVRIISNCLGDLITMVLTIFISCLVCGSLEYFAESNIPGTQFTSVPASIWWAAQTVIPLGYGDIIPQSTMGKLIGGVVVTMSALTFTLPLLFLGGKFLKYYSKNFGVTIQTDYKSKT